MTERIQTTRWTVDIELGERDGQTFARAALHSDDPTHLVGTGEAAPVPAGSYEVPEIGFEVAAGRALVALGSQLLAAGVTDVEAIQHGRRAQHGAGTGPDATGESTTRA